MKKHGFSTRKSHFPIGSYHQPSKLNFPTTAWHSPSRWRIQWVGEGILNARVDAGVGELQIVRGPERGDLFKMGTVGWANPTKILSCKLKGNSEIPNHDVEGPSFSFWEYWLESSWVHSPYRKSCESEVKYDH